MTLAPGPARAFTLAGLLLVLAIGEQLGPNALNVARCSLLVEAALEFDLNEPPPPEDDQDNQLGAYENDELSAPDELDEQVLLMDPVDSSVGVEVHKSSSSSMEGLEPLASGGEPRSRMASVWSSVKQKLPKYFDFSEFARKFKRNYKAAEASLRRSIFLAKCVEIFKSRVAYRMGKVGYLQSVNKFTDQSRDEISLMYMAAPPPELAKFASHAAELEDDVSATNRKYVSNLAERKRLLERPDTERIFMMDVDTQGIFGDDAEARAHHELHEFYQKQELRTYSSEQEEAMARALEEELKGVGMETMTQGIGQVLNGVELPWPGQLKSADAMDLDRGHKLMVNKYLAPIERVVLAQSAGGGGGGGGGGHSLDWSRHECFHAIYEQGSKCGQCYVMATTALAEFYKCSEAGAQKRVSQRKFSKHYVLTCAQKFTPTVMGCAGGSPLDTLRFISRAGIYNIRSWVQQRQIMLRDMRHSGELEMADEMTLYCPLDTSRTPIDEWGPIRVEMNPKEVSANEWMDALEDGPLVATVQLPPEGVDSYAGGVHDGADCATSSLWHSMILVGYGVGERGEPYWRFRNSFGPDWGDRGHFNLAMDVPGECLTGGVRVYREPLDS